MKLIKILEQIERNFPKNKWVNLRDDIEKDTDLRHSLTDLVKNAYNNIGGHIKLEKDPNRLVSKYNYEMGLDWDKDPDIDAFVFGKKGNYIKTSGIGHDGQQKSKKDILDKQAQDIKNGKIFSAVSDALAHILITKYHTPFIDNQKDVEKVLGKPVKWVGKRPDGKYEDYDAWFILDIQGNEKMKILMGRLN